MVAKSLEQNRFRSSHFVFLGVHSSHNYRPQVTTISILSFLIRSGYFPLDHSIVGDVFVTQEDWYLYHHDVQNGLCAFAHCVYKSLVNFKNVND